MAKVLVVTSGKGGVGKTTSTAALGAALAQSGQSVVVVDFDVGLRNLDLVMGAERRVVFDLINVVQGVAKLPQALIRDKRLENLWLLPASQTRDKDALTDRSDRFLAAEVVREKLFRLTGDELPYTSTVVIDSYEEEGKLRRIAATIVVERDSHKGMIIGSGGEALR